MPLEQLINLAEDQLKKEHAKAVQENNTEYVALINTIRLSRILKSAINIHGENEKEPVEIPFYEKNNRTYLLPVMSGFDVPGMSEYIPSVRTHFENVAAAHLGFRYPILFDLNILEQLVNNPIIKFIKNDKEITLNNDNVLNFNYETDDVAEIKVPDIWVPSGLEELEIAVEDMPTVDSGAILLKNVASRFQIGQYITKDSVFTDVYYSPNQGGEIPKAIILSRIMEVDFQELEKCLNEHDLSYKMVDRVLEPDDIDFEELIPAEIDLSTIWTAKTTDVIIAAIEDSEVNENVQNIIASIYKLPAKIHVNIKDKTFNIKLEVTYNTIIVFDGKLIFHDADNYNDPNREKIIELFKNKGIKAVIEEEADLSEFITPSRTTRF